eukprot:1821850-Prymnesium_polylepis.1
MMAAQAGAPSARTGVAFARQPPSWWLDEHDAMFAEIRAAAHPNRCPPPARQLSAIHPPRASRCLPHDARRPSPPAATRRRPSPPVAA